jgi:hypothetical protein
MLFAAASLDQQGEEQDHVHRKHAKEDVPKSLTTLNLRVSVGGTGDLKWI